MLFDSGKFRVKYGTLNTPNLIEVKYRTLAMYLLGGDGSSVLTHAKNRKMYLFLKYIFFKPLHENYPIYTLRKTGPTEDSNSDLKK